LKLFRELAFFCLNDSDKKILQYIASLDIAFYFREHNILYI
jgi:hypothetical protein